MKIARVSVDGEIFYGIVETGELKRIKGLPWDSIEDDGRRYGLEQVRLLAPVQPKNIVCVGRNYYDHIIEMGNQVPESPLLFYKPATSVIGPGDNILYPSITRQLEHEAELAVVIGKKASRVQPGQSREYIIGYTCLNDVTARDVQRREKIFVRSKGCDTCCPIGPWIETDVDAGNTTITCRVNGEEKQRASTSLMMHAVDDIICYVTECITLYPGDIIATGSPAGVSPMLSGDVVEVEIEGIGVLKNRVV